LDSFARQFLPKTGGGTVWATTTGALPTTNRLYSVNLRHLLSFTSGLEAEHGCISSNTVSHNDCITRVVTANANLAENTTNSGRTYFYNGSHLFVAAQMAVNATGMDSWASVFKRFKEIHGVFQSPIIPSDTAVMGAGAFYPYSEAGTFSPSPAGAMRYKAGDYAAFLLKLAKGQIISNALLDEMMSDQIAFLNTPIRYSPMLNDGEDWHYGLGLWTECPSATFSAACFEDRYSSAGSFGSYPFADFNLWDGSSHLLVGFLGYGGTLSGQAIKGINVYRSLGGGQVGVKDLAQKWAANKCP
jgi:CubicO group peptidase (beta-lactamase class C family)